MARLRRMLPTLPEGAALEHVLPATADNTPDPLLQRRAALASTLMAELELARQGSTTLDQDAPFGHILVASVKHTAA